MTLLLQQDWPSGEETISTTAWFGPNWLLIVVIVLVALAAASFWYRIRNNRKKK